MKSLSTHDFKKKIFVFKLNHSWYKVVRNINFVSGDDTVCQQFGLKKLQGERFQLRKSGESSAKTVNHRLKICKVS